MKTSTSFEPGRPKTGGRKPGTPNRTTQEMRDIMSSIHNLYLEQLQEDLDKMSPTNRWNILCKLAPFHMPTLSKNDNTNTTEGAVTIKVEYVDNINQQQVKLDEPVVPKNLAFPESPIQELPLKTDAQ